MYQQLLQSAFSHCASSFSSLIKCGLSDTVALKGMDIGGKGMESDDPGREVTCGVDVKWKAISWSSWIEPVGLGLRGRESTRGSKGLLELLDSASESGTLI